MRKAPKMLKLRKNKIVDVIFSIGEALLLLVIILILTDHQGIVLKVLNVVYFVLLIGTVIYIELLKT